MIPARRGLLGKGCWQVFQVQMQVVPAEQSAFAGKAAFCREVVQATTTSALGLLPASRCCQRLHPQATAALAVVSWA